MVQRVVTVADMAAPGVGCRRGQLDRIKVSQADNPCVVLADSGVIHDHAAHTPLAALKALYLPP
jgi:hypothetical protein